MLYLPCRTVGIKHERMDNYMQIKTAAIIGLGAIGCVYGRRLVKYMGDEFAVIAGGKRGDKLRENGIVIDGETLMPKVISPDDNNFKADLIILSVKNYALDSAIKDIENIITPETILLPIFNGIAGREKLAKAFPDNTVFYGLCRTDALRTDAVSYTHLDVYKRQQLNRS